MQLINGIIIKQSVLHANVPACAQAPGKQSNEIDVVQWIATTIWLCAIYS